MLQSQTRGSLSILARWALSCHRWKSLPPERTYGHQLGLHQETWICCFTTILCPCRRTVSYISRRSSQIIILAGKVKLHFDHAVPLHVFIDCLVLLQNLQKWVQSDFWPDLHNIIHFNVIFPLLQEIHQWPERLQLVKVKSHAGC